MSDWDLKKQVTPDDFLDKLRTAFWMEYDRVQRVGGQFKIKNLHQGLCHINQYKRVVEDHYKLCWILRTPINFQLQLYQNFDRADREIRDILDLPLKNDKGQVNQKVLAAKIDIWKALKEQIHGAPVQKNLNYNVTEERKEEVPKTAIDVDEELKQLESELS